MSVEVCDKTLETSNSGYINVNTSTEETKSASNNGVII